MATNNAFYKKFGEKILKACWEGEKALPPAEEWGDYVFHVESARLDTPYGFAVDAYTITVSTRDYASVIRMFGGPKFTPRALASGNCPKEFLDDLTELRRSAADRVRQNNRIDGSKPVKGGKTMKSTQTIDLTALASMTDEEKLAFLNGMVEKSNEEKAARKAALEERRRKLLEQLKAVEEELAQLA